MKLLPEQKVLQRNELGKCKQAGCDKKENKTERERGWGGGGVGLGLGEVQLKASSESHRESCDDRYSAGELIRN